MIIDNVENINYYLGLNNRLDLIFHRFSDKGYLDLKPGKHEIDQDRIFLIKNEYYTERKFADFLEAHKRYLDVQLILEGEEIIEWEVLDGQEILEQYNEEKDYSIFKPISTIKLKMKRGKFCVFFSK